MHGVPSGFAALGWPPHARRLFFEAHRIGGMGPWRRRTIDLWRLRRPLHGGQRRSIALVECRIRVAIKKTKSNQLCRHRPTFYDMRQICDARLLAHDGGRRNSGHAAMRFARDSQPVADREESSAQLDKPQKPSSREMFAPRCSRSLAAVATSLLIVLTHSRQCASAVNTGNI